MIPLVLLALGLGVALTAYELSPRARAEINDYARAIREAHAAHRAADAYLNTASMASVAAARHAQASVAAQLAVEPPAPPFVAPSMPLAPPMVQPPPPPSAAVPVPDLSVPTPLPTPTPDASALSDAHASAAQVASDAGVDHVIAATEANQEAARKTAEAAQKAKTEADRLAAAQSAAKVLEREKKIAAALASLGVGQCGVRSYARVTPQVKDALLGKLHAEGMTVTGNNPWDIDTHLYDVKLRAVWDPKTQVLKLIVTASAIYASCDAIWERIDPKVKAIIGP